jgi:hypothetical protein
VGDRLSEDQRCIVSATGSGKPWRGTVKIVKPKGYGVEPDGSAGEIVHVPERKAKPESSAKKTAPLVPVSRDGIKKISHEIRVLGAISMVSNPIQAHPKEKRIRAADYLRFVRKHPCCNCIQEAPSDPHHWGPKGISQKCDDLRSCPLCRHCHRTFHDTGRLPGLSKDETVVLFLRTQVSMLVEWVHEQSDEK